MTAVGVFVDQSVDEASAIARRVGLDAIQLHGDEDAGDYRGAATPIDQVGRRPRRSREAEADGCRPARRCCWTHTIRSGAAAPGQTIDWTMAATIARRRPVILSGGLTPETVDAAVRAVRPVRHRRVVGRRIVARQKGSDEAAGVLCRTSGAL